MKGQFQLQEMDEIFYKRTIYLYSTALKGHFQ